MKISLRVLDLVRLDIQLERGDAGVWVFRGLFSEFLGRPGKPHLSLFTKPLNGFFSPHFTVWRGHHRQFRRTLARFAPSALAAFQEKADAQASGRWVQSLTATTIDELEREGWTVHFVDWKAIKRWLQPHCIPGASLPINDDVVFALTDHIVRHGIRPRDLVSVTEYAIAPILRESGDSLESRTLFHFPTGVWREHPGGKRIMVHPAGWYWLPIDWVGPHLSGLIPIARVERILSHIKGDLKRVPRREPIQEKPALPAFVSHIFGLYASDLLRLAIGLTIQAAQEAALKAV